jgi:tetratricopeptide (TPR) repeat protein
VADSVREVGGQVEYTIGDNTYAIPASMVLKIDAGKIEAVKTDPGAPVTTPPTKSPPPDALDMPTARAVMKTSAELAAIVIRGGKVDPDALHAIEKEGDADKSAAANFIAADFESKRKNIQGASVYLRSALGFLPGNAVLLESYASVLLALGRTSEALSYAQRATQADPQSADAFAMLGYAWYASDHNREAIAAWKKSLQLRPSDNVRNRLARVERESEAEAQFRQQESNHFVLRYEGSQSPENLRNQVLAVLEEQYKVLSNDLGTAPRNIYVSLYTDQAFLDVTQAPAWSAALNDGKIRVPVSGMDQITPELARVLRHELTHSFVAQIVHGHSPQWLNEGLAQLEEGRTTAPVGVRLAALYVSGNQVPLNQLEGYFGTYTTPEAVVAYAEGLAAMEYIRSFYGMAAIAGILKRLGQGDSVETALRNTIHIGYAQLEIEITNYLKRNYKQ